MLDIHILHGLAVISVGVAMGCVNVLAGGGSILSVPLLMFLGLPPLIANGTNRLAILVQNASAIIAFRKQNVFILKQAFWLSIPALFGSAIGTTITKYISDDIFKKIFAAVILFVLVSMVFKKKMFKFQIQNKYVLYIVFFCIGIYGGFIQAGVGFVIILSLTSFTNFDLIRINAVKVAIVFYYTVVAVILFALNDKVDWQLALLLSCGAGFGGWIGSYLATSINEKIVRYIVIVMGIIFSIRLVLV